MSKSKKNSDKLHKLGLLSDKAKLAYEKDFLNYAEESIESNVSYIKKNLKTDSGDELLFLNFA